VLVQERVQVPLGNRMPTCFRNCHIRCCQFGFRFRSSDLADPTCVRNRNREHRRNRSLGPELHMVRVRVRVRVLHRHRVLVHRNQSHIHRHEDVTAIHQRTCHVKGVHRRIRNHLNHTLVRMFPQEQDRNRNLRYHRNANAIDPKTICIHRHSHRRIRRSRFHRSHRRNWKVSHRQTSNYIRHRSPY
jgi:hypothetical protein